MLITDNSVACIIPARNEAGYLIDVVNKILNVEQIGTIIIVEGGSIDNTWEVSKKLVSKFPSKIAAYKQPGKGKFDAVIFGAKQVHEKLILIWDADGTVPIEGCQKIILSALSSQGPVMGDRLRGKIEKGAMQFANFIGNWFFAFLLAPIIGSKPVDTLCGTKIFPRECFINLEKEFVRWDPYGDFALIGQASLMGLKIKSEVVDYRARVYGETNIKRWRGGVQLLITTLVIYKKFIMKFIFNEK